MELSEQTIEVLKNFSTINQSILILQGNQLKSLANGGTIMGSTEVPESFPVECAIYDLPKFLNTLKLYSEPVLDWQEDHVGISEKSPDGEVRTLRYMYSNKKTVFAPKKDMQIPTTEVNFKLKEDELKSLKQASSILGMKHLMVVPSDSNNKVLVSVVDIKKIKGAKYGGTKYTIEVDAEIEDGVKDFILFFEVEHMKLMMRDYDVGVAKLLYSHWMGIDIEYFIALDKISKMDVV